MAQDRACKIAGIRRWPLWSACLLAALVILQGCGSKKSGSPSGGEAKPRPSDSTAEGVAPSRFRHIFFGTSGGKDRIQMDLLREGGKIRGLYAYEALRSKGTARFRRIEGSIEANGTVVATVSDWDHRPMGSFRGRVFVQSSKSREIVKIAGEQISQGKAPSVSLEASNTYDLDGRYLLATKTTHRLDQEHKYEVDAIYPEMEGGEEPKAREFNRYVKEFVSRQVEAFTEAYNDAPLDDGPPGTSSLEIDFEIVRASSKLISLLFRVSEYNVGAAHPMSYVYSINYDASGSRVLSLKDIFLDGKDHLRAISDYCVRELSAREVGNEETRDEGAGPREDNYKKWVVVNDGLEIHFDPYEVASYAEGEQQVLVPLEVLDGLLRPEARELFRASK